MVGTIKSDKRRGRTSLNSEINITPFVDVMLVLLIIFMVTSPMLVTGIKLDLPTVSNTTPLELEVEPLTIDIDQGGQIYIQEMPILISDLEAKLKNITEQKYDTKIVIRGDKHSNYGMIMEVIVNIKQAGFDKISLVNSSSNNSKTEHKKTGK